MFLKSSGIFNNISTLACLAAESLLKSPELALKTYKDKFIHVYPLKVSQFTEFDLQRLQIALQKLNLPEGVFVYTTGSDGKLEKSCRKESPIELLFVCDLATKDQIIEKIDTLMKSGLIPIFDRFEYKDVKSPTLNFCDITKTLIPSRFLHNLHLMGSDEQLDELTLKFVADLQQMPGKDRTKFMDKFIKVHSKQMNDVLAGKEIVDVDLSKGVVSYSGMGRKATKYSLLRPIQYTLDLMLIDEVRSKKLTQIEYAKILIEMPRRVPDQIDHMYNLGFLPHLSPEDVSDLKQAYTLGLFYFQTAQHLVSSTGKGSVQFPIPDKEELVKAYIDTARILTKMKSKK